MLFFSLNNIMWTDKYVKYIITNSHFIWDLIQNKLDIACFLKKNVVEIIAIPRIKIILNR